MAIYLTSDPRDKDGYNQNEGNEDLFEDENSKYEGECK